MRRWRGRVSSVDSRSEWLRSIFCVMGPPCVIMQRFIGYPSRLESRQTHLAEIYSGT